MKTWIIIGIVILVLAIIGSLLPEETTTEEQPVQEVKKESTRLIQILGDRYDDGVVAVLIGMFDETGDICDWSGGILTLDIKDGNGNTIKTATQQVGEEHYDFCTQYGGAYEIDVGSEISDVRSMDAKFESDGGYVYTITDIDLTEMLESGTLESGAKISEADETSNQYCQDYCEELYPSSAQDEEYTACVLTCVLG
jgi:hypothetical protein